VIEHIVAGGCSFTADGVGGIPPNLHSPEGACSFVSDGFYTAAEPKSWVSFLAQQLQVKSLVNLASSGHGNMATANNIISLLTRFKYDKTKTIILFNITDAGRLDLMCDWSHPAASTQCTWPWDTLNFKYLDNARDLAKSTKKTMGIDQVEICSVNAVWGLIGFLTVNGYNFKFLTMRDYTEHYPAEHPMSQLLNQYQAHWIKLSGERGLVEYVQKQNLAIGEGDFHPTVDGHRMIAQEVLKCL